MNEVSIIINGVRYDATYYLHDDDLDCSNCDLKPHCRDIGFVICQ